VKVVAAADRAVYKPGERARLDFTVSGVDGHGIPAAVSVVAVDDALLAMTGEHPGLAQALVAQPPSAERGVASRPRLGEHRRGRLCHNLNFPLDAMAFGPAEGKTDAAMAALAAIPPNAATKGNIQDWMKTSLDSGEAKLAEMSWAKSQAGERMKPMAVWFGDHRCCINCVTVCFR